ncbi:hypothetical protein [Amycolatopsis oliviviridis]|uniref:hypothetical protein n=1 Tax=Amycolatopsis oliviviridis TaxID=1471590 RepID=UPI001748BA02|nr:hypothetical protein [Amycolatopsis oliviviridis]
MAGTGQDEPATYICPKYRPAEVSVLSHADPLPAAWQSDGHGATISAATYARGDQDAASGFGR